MGYREETWVGEASDRVTAKGFGPSSISHDAAMKLGAGTRMETSESKIAALQARLEAVRQFRDDDGSLTMQIKTVLEALSAAVKKPDRAAYEGAYWQLLETLLAGERLLVAASPHTRAVEELEREDCSRGGAVTTRLLTTQSLAVMVFSSVSALEQWQASAPLVLNADGSEPNFLRANESGAIPDVKRLDLRPFPVNAKQLASICWAQTNGRALLYSEFGCWALNPVVFLAISLSDATVWCPAYRHPRVKELANKYWQQSVQEAALECSSSVSNLSAHLNSLLTAVNLDIVPVFGSLEKTLAGIDTKVDLQVKSLKIAELQLLAKAVEKIQFLLATDLEINQLWWGAEVECRFASNN